MRERFAELFQKRSKEVSNNDQTDENMMNLAPFVTLRFTLDAKFHHLYLFGDVSLHQFVRSVRGDTKNDSVS